MNSKFVLTSQSIEMYHRYSNMYVVILLVSFCFCCWTKLNLVDSSTVEYKRYSRCSRRSITWQYYSTWNAQTKTSVSFVFLRFVCLVYNFSFRQQDTQRQLEKITDLVRLIVQKMDVPTKMGSGSAAHNESHENWSKFRDIQSLI